MKRLILAQTATVQCPHEYKCAHFLKKHNHNHLRVFEQKDREVSTPTETVDIPLFKYV